MPKNLIIFGFFLLTYAQKFIPMILKFPDTFAHRRSISKYAKSLILLKFNFLLSSQAIQSKPYFSRLCGASCIVFNKVIHSFLGLLLKGLKNNNLSVFSRNFMSYKLSELMLLMLQRTNKSL